MYITLSIYPDASYTRNGVSIKYYIKIYNFYHFENICLRLLYMGKAWTRVFYPTRHTNNKNQKNTKQNRDTKA